MKLTGSGATAPMSEFSALLGRAFEEYGYMTTMFMQGDCLERMAEIPDGSVDMILADPPYGTMKGAQLDGWRNRNTDWDTTIDHTALLEQCNRVLRTNGALVMFSQEPYTSRITTQAHGNLPFSYRLIWLKDHFANALLCNYAACRTSLAQVMSFSSISPKPSVKTE